MNAMLLESIAPIESSPLGLCSVPKPVPGPGEARIRVHCCAICRTDLHIIEGDLPVARLPIIPGHQVVGVVDELGANCRHLQPGQRVGIAWLRHVCGRCEYCNSERENLCPQQRFTGYHADGGYAEYAVVAEDFAYPLPDTFVAADAAPLLCAGIIGYRALRRCRVTGGQRLALYGFGASAHIVLQIALRRGCEVYVVSRGESHRQLALEMGATWSGNDASEMPERANSAIIFAPSGVIVPTALAALRPGGTLAIAGIHMTDVPRLNYEAHLFHERDVRSVTANTRADGRALLLEAAAAGIRPQTTHYDLADANRALQDLKAGNINGAGVLMIEH